MAFEDVNPMGDLHLTESVILQGDIFNERYSQRQRAAQNLPRMGQETPMSLYPSRILRNIDDSPVQSRPIISLCLLLVGFCFVPLITGLGLTFIPYEKYDIASIFTGFLGSHGVEELALVAGTPSDNIACLRPCILFQVSSLQDAIVTPASSFAKAMDEFERTKLDKMDILSHLSKQIVQEVQSLIVATETFNDSICIPIEDFNVAPLDFGVTSAQGFVYGLQNTNKDIKSAFKSLKTHLHAFYCVAMGEVVSKFEKIRLRKSSSAWFRGRGDLKQLERDGIRLEEALRCLRAIIEGIRRFVQDREERTHACAP